jgi:hypothetical protein
MIPKVIAPHPQPLPALREGRQSVALAGWGAMTVEIYAENQKPFPSAQELLCPPAALMISLQPHMI